MRQRLLENLNLSLVEATVQARALERAQVQSEAYGTEHTTFAVQEDVTDNASDLSSSKSGALDIGAHDTVAAMVKRCSYCGGSMHPRYRCAARDASCHNCGKSGHFAKVCRLRTTQSSSTNNHKRSSRNQTASLDYLSAVANGVAEGLKSAVCKIMINGRRLEALVDTGSTKSFIKTARARELGLSVQKSSGTVCLAATQHRASVTGECTADIRVQGDMFRGFRLAVMDDLCAPVLLGHDFLEAYDCVTVKFGGKKSQLDVCCLVPADVESPRLFENLRPDCRPIQTKSRRRSSSEAAFIKAED